MQITSSVRCTIPPPAASETENKEGSWGGEREREEVCGVVLGKERMEEKRKRKKEVVER